MCIRDSDDRGGGGLPARRQARPRGTEAIRHLLEVVGPMLGDDELLPGARAGAVVARQPRLQGRLHRRHDAQGSESRTGGRARNPCLDPARRGRRRGLRAIRAER